MGLLTNEDSMLFQTFFKEMTKLRGIKVQYIYPVIEDISIHGQIFPKFSSIFDLDIMFETNPKIKTLKNYGWISEDSENKPYIAYLPIDTPYIQSKARLKINPIGSNKQGKWFEITEISEAIEYPDAYACKLAPIFINEPEKLDYSETNNNYIEGDNQPDESTNHIKAINENLEEHIEKDLSQTLNKNFTYFKI